MKSHISQTVDKWLNEEDRPRIVRMARKASPWYGMTEEEIEDRKEFIRHYLLKAFELLPLIPVPSREYDFWYGSHQEFLESAFNTHDFQRVHSSFDRYDYRLRKILQEVKDLALLHSCISQAEGRQNIRNRFEIILDNEFRDQLLNLVEKYRKTLDEDQRFDLRRKVARLNRHIMECKKIWEEYSPWEDYSSHHIPNDSAQDCQTSPAGQGEVFQKQ